MTDGPDGQRRSRAGRYAATGWLMVTLVFGGLGAWSVFAPFEGAVLTSGSIVVESSQQAIQHLEGGIVAGIDVREGDLVEAGATLLTLDGTATQARLASIEARLMGLIGREARLLAERDDRDEPVLDPAHADFADNAELAGILLSQASLFRARAASRRTQVSLLRQRIRQLEARITGVGNEIAANELQASLIGEEIADLSVLLDRGLSPKPRVLALQRDKARLDGEREALIAQVATTRVQIGEAELELNHLTEGFREAVLTELQDVQTQIAELSEQRISARDQLRRLDIVSPRDGRIIGIKTHTIGGVIGAGEPIMHVVPEDDELVARVRIAPRDIDKVSAGAPATLRFTAFSAQETPEIPGEVIRVSADALQDEATGILYFEGLIRIPRDNETLGDFELVPGMPVDAQVRTESRTVISYLLKPLADAVTATFRE